MLAAPPPYPKVNPVSLLIPGQNTIQPSVALSVAATWPLANAAFGVPFEIQTPTSLSQIIAKCAVAGGANYDLGLYDVNLNRLGSKGSTATGVGLLAWAPAGGIALAPGRYFAYMSVNNAVAVIDGLVASQAVNDLWGSRFDGASFPLPAIAGGALSTNTYSPLFTIVLNS